MKRKTARKANDTDAAAGGRPLSKMPSEADVEIIVECVCGWRGPVADPPVCGGCGSSLAAAAAAARAFRDARAVFDRLSRPQPAAPLSNGCGRPASDV